MKKTLIILLVFFSFSCAKESNVISDNEYVIINYKGYPSTNSAKPTTLDFEEILEIESIINKEVLEIFSFHKALTKASYLKDKKEVRYTFVRQYVPFLNNQNEKVVIIYFICNPNEGFKEWKNTTYNIIDGGSCYFNIWVNISKKTIIQSNINSVALIQNN